MDGAAPTVTHVVYALPAALAALVGLALAVIIWLWHRRAPGAKAFMLFMGAVALWNAAYAVEQLLSDLPAKLIASRIAYLGIVTSPVFWLLFVLHYAGMSRWLTRGRLLALFIVPAATLLLVWTDPWHHLYWSSVRLDLAIAPVPIVRAVRGPGFWVFAVYSYLLLLAALIVLLHVGRPAGSLYRGQATALVIASLLPWVGNALTLARVDWILPGYDLTSIGFAIAGIPVMLSFIQLNLLDIVPAARGLVMDNMRAAVFVVDARNRLIDLNPAAAELLGVRAGDVLGRPFEEAVPDSFDLVERVRDVPAAGGEVRLEIGGETRFFHLQISPLRGGERGRLRGRIVVLHDVTERRQVEAAEREQRVLAEALRDTAAALNSTLDLDDVLDRILDNVGRVVPHDTSNIMLIEDDVARIVRSRGYLDRTDAEIVQQLRFGVSQTINLRRMVETGEPIIIPDVATYQGWVENPEEASWHRSYVGAPIRVDGEVIGFVNLDSETRGFFRPEHAERLQAFADQAAIAVKNARVYGVSQLRNVRLEQLNAITRAGITTFDLRQLLRAVTGMAAEMAGADRSALTLWDERRVRIELAARSAPDGVSIDRLPDDPVEQALSHAVLASGGPLIVRGESEYPPGMPPFPGGALLALPLQVEGQNLGALILSFDAPRPFRDEDVMWAQQAADLIALVIGKARTYAELEARNQELDAFGHTVAHDLRSPLNVVTGYISMLQYFESENLTDEGREMLDQAERAAMKIDDIIEALLMLARLHRAEQPVASVDMRPVIRAALERFAAEIEERGIRVRVAPDLPPALGYTAWLEEVFANLIGNAVKYMGRDTADPCIDIRGERRGDVARYEVEDNGLGIAPDVQARLFEMFARFHTEHAAGMGLGLSIVKRVITRLNGRVGVSSTQGAGSTFWIELPAPADTPGGERT
jgi:PAS domain S-box-containing protein